VPTAFERLSRAGEAGSIYCNITVTGLSVAVELLIGTIELGGLVASQLGLAGPFWTWLDNIDLNTAGFLMVGMFVATWAIALAVWKYGRIEQRSSTHLIQPEQTI
jgi:high-affinity nickel-transport protein